jgi:hypothetical protein
MLLTSRGPSLQVKRLLLLVHHVLARGLLWMENVLLSEWSVLLRVMVVLPVMRLLLLMLFIGELLLTGMRMMWRNRTTLQLLWWWW